MVITASNMHAPQSCMLQPSQPYRPPLLMLYCAAVLVFRFKGSLSDLRAVRGAVDSLVNRPCVLLKDFVVDEYQLVEARVAGADTALLIVAILPLPRLVQLMAVSRSLGMEPLVEVANAPEMATALQAGARLIGVNNRDLHTFSVDTSTTNTLAAMIERREQSNPEDFRVLLAALSGIKSEAGRGVVSGGGLRGRAGG